MVQPGVKGTQVTLQRQQAGKWKTIGVKRSKELGFVAISDKKAPQASKVRYRLFAADSLEFALTVTARTK
jgi:hypothetical protein